MFASIFLGVSLNVSVNNINIYLYRSIVLPTNCNFNHGIRVTHDFSITLINQFIVKKSLK